MGALVHALSWMPEDDLLLKNSVEAGASLESLAKGAVQFSQKFTVRELQERWHSLLYDPVVSREAAARMIEVEHSASTLPWRPTRGGFPNESRCVSGKRKMESVHGSYRALRKKICHESFSTVDMSLLIEGPDSANFPLYDSNLGVLHHAFPPDGIADTFPSFCPPHHSIHQADAPPLCEAPESDLQKESTMGRGHVNGCSLFDKNPIFTSSPIVECGSPNHKLEFPEVLLWDTVGSFSVQDAAVDLEPGSDAKLRSPKGEMEGGDVEELGGSVLEVPDGGEFFLGVEDGDGIRKSFYDGLDSFLLGSPKVADECFVSSAPGLDLQLPEMVDGPVCCVLNTEVVEIPCNDHVVFCRRHSPPKSVALEDVGLAGSCRPHCLISRRFVGNHEGFGKPCTSSASVPCVVARRDLCCRGTAIADMDAGQNFVAKNQKPATPLEETAEPALGSDGFETHHQDRACCLNGRLDSLERTENGQILSQRVGSESASPLEIAEDKLFLDSDDDIPYFSDMEAMILDMDLDSDDRDLCSREEVSRYQHRDIKQKIMRLEQGAYAYLQRAMASRGAFAILYGRHTKHYIKKREVLLGRATEDVIVDIDLSMEGRANKISRRQAVIQLRKNGSFILKNLGKHSICVNDKEITSGHSIVLISNCLIEIRGISFIFEINQSFAKQCGV